jgi:hypothetical protein
MSKAACEANTRPVPIGVQKKIPAEANSCCGICEGGDLTVLEIHHIEPRANGGGNKPDNLIAVCPNCHTRITKGEISTYDVFRAKLRLVQAAKQERSRIDTPHPPSNVIQFNRSRVAGSIVANHVTVKTAKAPKMNPPPGAIAGDLQKLNYIKYLIERYHTFKRADRNIGKMNYAAIYSAIKREFKAAWNLVPVERFDELATYLQHRIDNTILGKHQRKIQVRRYSTFDEFRAGMRLG